MNAWLLFILPLASAAIIQLGLKRNAMASAGLSTISVFLTFVISLSLLGGTDGDTIPWISIGSLDLKIGYHLDQLSTGMMIVVTGIGLLVHLFSLGYMKDDEAKARYFNGLSIFMFSMTGIVLASNFIMMFIFWELVGLSSYLLIGHWYQKDSAADAAKKAFLTNRIGDFGFMIGILMLWCATGTVVFSQLAEGNAFGSLTPCLAGTIILLIFCGAVGKSAQLPLHVWLPDAMEGPTPVSALIHAATMVAAGVYMMARLFLSLAPEGIELSAVIPAWSAETISWVGGLTALLAALMATQQNDIKKILAYSTLSQLGYMVMAIGLLAPEAGMFHLFTHAWFKALLFLGSGAVIYACHHEQDIWKMGGLMKKMPITGATFLVGTAALTAVPFTSGFYSKENILVAAKDTPFFWIAVGVAALTTFYMLRLYFIAFLGKARAHGAEEAKEAPLVMTLPLIVLGIMAIASPFIAKIFPVANEWNMHFAAMPHAGLELYCSLGALALGIGVAFFLYFGKDKDPINIPLFENKFYLDEIYAIIVKVGQDCVAMIIHFIDEFVIDGLLVGGLSRCAAGAGNIFRRYAQNGSLSNYAALMAVGVLLVIYFTVFS